MRLPVVGACLVVMTLLVSCSSSDEGEPDGSSAESSETSSTSPSNEEGTATTDPSAAPSDGEASSTTIAPVDDDPPSTLAPGPQPPATEASPSLDELSGFRWQTVNPEAPWSARAGLRVVELGDRLILMGGRTPEQSNVPGESTIWSDVWASDDDGATWIDLLDGGSAPWPARAYFQAVVKDETIYVIGGQDFGLEPNPFCALLEQGLEPPPALGIDPDAPCPEFLPTSNFFNDVWRSDDGVTWTQVTETAPWEPRAGLSAAVLGDHIYVLAGSQNDDSSIIGPDGPARIYYQDVWRSSDGQTWELMTDTAPWEPRAGAAAVVRDGLLYLFGGEDGFTCEPLPDCDAPYFNDVWVTGDGADWKLVTEAAGWSPRPGHVCELVGNQFLCFGGFGLVENPTDMWISSDGASWDELPTSPWASSEPADMRYDFESLVLDDGVSDPTVLTFGGDRETFDFADPENYLRVDNDVWSFAPPVG